MSDYSLDSRDKGFYYVPKQYKDFILNYCGCIPAEITDVIYDDEGEFIDTFDYNALVIPDEEKFFNQDLTLEKIIQLNNIIMVNNIPNIPSILPYRISELEVSKKDVQRLNIEFIKEYKTLPLSNPEYLNIFKTEEFYNVYKNSRQYDTYPHNLRHLKKNYTRKDFQNIPIMRKKFNDPDVFYITLLLLGSNYLVDIPRHLMNKWIRLYNILKLKYNPLENYNKKSVITTNAEENKNINDSGTVKDVDSSTTTNNNTQTVVDTSVNTENSTNNETQTSNSTINNSGSDALYNSGFNSNEPVIKEKHVTSENNSQENSQNTNSTQTTNANLKNNKNISDNGTVNGEGSNTSTRNLQTSETGNSNVSTTETTTGNIGVMSSQQMLNAEWEIRKIDFWHDIVFEDIRQLLFKTLY